MDGRETLTCSSVNAVAAGEDLWLATGGGKKDGSLMAGWDLIVRSFV